jgi:hypothetical protein
MAAPPLGFVLVLVLFLVLGTTHPPTRQENENDYDYKNDPLLLRHVAALQHYR